MNFEKIAFDNLRDYIEDFFSISQAQNWNLVPDDIHRLAKQANINLKWEKIDWWASFENGNIEVDTEEFFKILFKKISPKDNKVIIVTDECFKDKLAYYINTKDVMAFSNEIYPKLHGMSFFQPLDFIFLFPNQKLLIVLHHEGAVMQFQAEH